MKRYLKIYYLLSVLSIRRTTQNQFGGLLYIFGKLVRFFMFFLFIYFLITKTGVLNGYSAKEALIVLMTFELVGSLGGLLFREVYRFRQLVVSSGGR